MHRSLGVCSKNRKKKTKKVVCGLPSFLSVTPAECQGYYCRKFAVDWRQNEWNERTHTGVTGGVQQRQLCALSVPTLTCTEYVLHSKKISPPALPPLNESVAGRCTTNHSVRLTDHHTVNKVFEAFYCPSARSVCRSDVFFIVRRTVNYVVRGMHACTGQQ